jgi:heme-binding NEAT domain protein
MGYVNTDTTRIKPTQMLQTGFNFPVPEPIATPSDTPGASGPNSASPTFTPANGVNTPSNNNTTDGLTHDNQVLVGVLVGVGVPLAKEIA